MAKRGSDKKQGKLHKTPKGGRNVLSSCPGSCAGNTTRRIFGRSDCVSGKRKMKKENRVFLHMWEGANAAGYRPCRLCRPSPHCRGTGLLFLVPGGWYNGLHDS